MAKSRLIGDYPVIGIRPTIDGRRGKIKVRESLEDQTMNMAKSAAKLIEENVFYPNGEHVKVIIADTTIGRVAEAAACALAAYGETALPSIETGTARCAVPLRLPRQKTEKFSAGKLRFSIFGICKTDRERVPLQKQFVNPGKTGQEGC